MKVNDVNAFNKSTIPNNGEACCRKENVKRMGLFEVQPHFFKSTEQSVSVCYKSN